MLETFEQISNGLLKLIPNENTVVSYNTSLLKGTQNALKHNNFIRGDHYKEKEIEGKTRRLNRLPRIEPITEKMSKRQGEDTVAIPPQGRQFHYEKNTRWLCHNN
jgi:hypothetical protein